MLNLIPTTIPEVLIIEPKIFKDNRGYFFEFWNKEVYQDVGIQADFIQDNESMSTRGVLRGLHYQLPPYTQAKLVRVIDGTVLDIAVDIRKGSPTFGKHAAVELSAENRRQLFIPRGFAHGFIVLTSYARFLYKCDNRYMPSHERGIAFNDPALGIDWRLPPNQYILSPKDQKNPLSADAELFDFNRKEYLK